MKFKNYEYLLICFVLFCFCFFDGVCLRSLKGGDVPAGDCVGWTDSTIILNVELLVKMKMVDEDFKITTLGEERVCRPYQDLWQKSQTDVL